MKKKILEILMLLFILPLVLGMSPNEKVQFDSPVAGDILQGKVTVTGTTDVVGFLYTEVLFSYDGDATDTWFLIDQNSKPVSHGPIAEWDTTTITDGKYRLRIKVFIDDGTTSEVTIGGLQVRNYSPVEATDVLPTQLAEGLAPTQVVQEVEILSTSTDFPDNTAELTEEGVKSGVLRGIVLFVIFILVVSIYFVVRALVKRG